jgi:hypothetical protein
LLSGTNIWTLLGRTPVRDEEKDGMKDFWLSHRLQWRVGWSALLVVCALGLAACGGGGGGGGGSSSAAARSLVVDVPGDTRGTVGQPIGSIPGVRLVDGNGAAVAGAVVNFRVEPSGSVSPASMTTGADGRARPQSWVLGTTSGAQVLVASAAGATDRRFTVSADPGPPVQLALASVEEQTGDINTAVASPPRVRVGDSFNNPVAGVTVRFTVENGGGTVSSATAVTGSDGIAALESWTLGGSPGLNKVRGTVDGIGYIEFWAEAVGQLEVSIDAIQLNQASQTSDAAIPGVAGRPGLLRVVVSANRSNTITPPVLLRLYQDGVQQWEQRLPARVVGVPTSPNLDIENQTWNVRLDASEIRPGMAVEAIVDPDNEYNLSSRENARFPRGSGAAPLEVRSLAPMRVMFIPVRLSDGTTGSIPGTDTLLRSSRQWLPVGELLGTARSQPFSTDRDITDSDEVSKLLGDLLALRLAEAATDEYYHGIMPAINNIAVAGMAYVPWGPPSSARVAVSIDGPQSPATIAHELGHNLGRLHSPCGDVEDADPAFPHPNAGIGSPGYAIVDRLLRAPGNFSDFMSYCRPYWTSDHTYERILAWRLQDPFATAAAGDEPIAAAESPGAEREGGLLVWGRVGQAGVELNPVFSLESRPVLPDMAGPHRVRGIAADGRVLFELPFEGNPVPHSSDPEERGFGFFVPLSGEAFAALDRVELLSPFGMASHQAAGRQEQGERVMALSDGQLPMSERLPDGGLRLRWDAARHPAMMLRDQRSGQVLAIARSGELRLPAEIASAVEPEMLLSDGVGTASSLRISVQPR